MGQSAGSTPCPSNVGVVVFAPLLVEGSVVLRVHGEGRPLLDDCVETFPASLQLPVFSRFADAAAGGPHESEAPFLEVTLRTGDSEAQAVVPLEALRELAGARLEERPAAGFAQAFESLAAKGCAAEREAPSAPGLRWAPCCLLLGFGTGRVEFQRSLELGRRLDAPKLLLAFCDPELGMRVGAGLAARPRRVPDRAADTLQLRLEQLDASLRSLHRGLEDLEPEGEVTRGLWELGRRDRAALLEANDALRQQLESELGRFEQEVNSLRVAHRRAVQEQEEQPVSSSERLREGLRSEISKARDQTEDLRQRLIDQRVRIGHVEHQALSADKDKEQALKLFMATHQELRYMKEKYLENEQKQTALEAEIKDLEMRLAGLNS